LDRDVSIVERESHRGRDPPCDDLDGACIEHHRAIELEVPMRIVVTGGSGKLGRAVVADLVGHGHEVWNVDLAPAREAAGAATRFTRVDLTDFGQVYELFQGIDEGWDSIDGIVHLAAIPGPAQAPNAALFGNNIVGSHNVFSAARHVGIRNIVWASSETLLGLPFDTPPPYVPVDEEYPVRPETAYSLAKALDEEMARHFCRWDPQLKMIGLRFSNVMEPADYARFPSFDSDPLIRKWNLWGYIDARDGAQAVRRALEHEATGMDVFIIANPDTVMSRPSADLVAEVFPGVPVRKALGTNETLLSIDKARRVLGYEPRHSWRDEVTGG
jgi:nucleoside-diphosphate-sugar epimerase